jgi:glyoxylase-like metal-dependent hydrolase (beta-lactamase superfamily II)
MLVRQIHAGSMRNFAYLAVDEPTRAALVIDPSGAVAAIERATAEATARVELIVHTHGHADHTAGTDALAQATGARVAAHRSAAHGAVVPLDHGSVLEVGGLRVRVIHTPGHTPDGLCLLVEGCVFTGDTLFVGECGRADLPGSDPTALYHSLFDQLLALPDETRVYPGHDYGASPHSTIGAERRTNYTLEPRTEAEFVAFMAEP